MADDYRDRVKAAILDEQFVRATLSSPAQGESAPWSRVVLRPVQVKGRRRIQVAFYDARRCITKNYAPGDTAHLDDVLAHGFQSIHVETTTGSLHVRIGKGGKARIRTGAPSVAARTPDLAHNREKRLILPADCPDPFLQAVGIMTKDGAVKADMQRKFRQINEFLAVIDQTLQYAATRGGDAADPTRGGAANPISVVDCGCGNAYLTFAAYHYFRHVRDMPARLVGIDANAGLIADREATARELGWTGLSFEATPIAGYTPAAPPDMVLALHACDTATDDALAQAIKWRSEVILCAPCCHHHLQRQLAAQRATLPSVRPLLRHGLLRERLGDVITDAFRALILRVMGYRTDVIEFVSTEHTPRNVMIRAVKATRPGDRAFVQEYNDLKAAWQVTPYLEEALGDQLAALLTSQAEPDHVMVD